MSTNILNLNKVERQTILTDITSFNLSEQVRSAVLLLEDKWVKKNIDLRLDFDEFTVEANEELLKQVWINLIDNAVKFTDVGGIVELDVFEDGKNVFVRISNSGEEIPKDKRDKLFNKFYQGDESRSVGGNGIGLAIVKRIVDLHSASITVNSENGLNSFTVLLPKKQK
jgi:signal transduction histidine kinase